MGAFTKTILCRIHKAHVYLPKEPITVQMTSSVLAGGVGFTVCSLSVAHIIFTVSATVGVIFPPESTVIYFNRSCI